MTESDDKKNEEGKTKKAIADFLAQKQSGANSKAGKGSFDIGNQKSANTKVGNKNFKRNKI
jgi:hypothetical protein